MDEPFSAVDALIRGALQAELSRIWRQSDFPRRDEAARLIVALEH